MFFSLDNDVAKFPYASSGEFSIQCRLKKNTVDNTFMDFSVYIMGWSFQNISKLRHNSGLYTWCLVDKSLFIIFEKSVDKKSLRGNFMDLLRGARGLCHRLCGKSTTWSSLGACGYLFHEVPCFYRYEPDVVSISGSWHGNHVKMIIFGL